MTYSLYCHTPRPRSEGTTITVPPVESSTSAILLWENLSTYSTQDAQVFVGMCGNPVASIYGPPAQKHFACSPDGQQIMVWRSFGGSFEYSDDGGATWAIRYMDGITTDTYEGAYFGQDIQYHPDQDAFFIVFMYDVIQQASQQRRGYTWYTKDGGVTWTRIDDLANNDYHRDMFKCIVMQDGSIMAHASKYSGDSGNRVIKYTAPGVSAALLDYDFGTNTTVYVRYSGEVDGGYLITNVPTYGMVAVPSTCDSFNDIGTQPALAALANCFNPNGVALMMESVVSQTFTYKIVTGTSTDPLPEGTITTDNEINGYQFAYGGGLYLFAGGVNIADYELLEVWISTSGDAGSWTGPYYWDLGTLSKKNTSQSTSGQTWYQQWFQIRYGGGGNWYVFFRDIGSTNNHVIVSVPFGSAGDGIPLQYGPLRSAIDSQAPDIFYRLDDEIDSTTVVDDGRSGYTNAVYGSGITFEQAALVADNGTAALVAGTSNIGIMADNVVDASDHSHVFVFQHDGTASVRTLAGSGVLSYSIYLTADHKLAVDTYDGASWTSTISSTVIAADTTTLAAIRINAPDGGVDIYLEDALDTVATDLTIQPETNTRLSVLGGWTGGVGLQNSADGVTLDYYAMIDNSNFDYSAINEAYGGTYVKPAAPTDSGTSGESSVEFLIHLDDTSLTGPFPSSRTTTPYYNVINSVPGTINRVSTEVSTGRIVTTDKQFGAGSGFVEARRPYQDDFYPWDNIYWPIWNATPQQMGLPELELGQRPFNYDLWMKSLDGGQMIAASNNWLTRIGGQYYSYGGLVIMVMPEIGDPTQARIIIRVGSPRTEAATAEWQFQMIFRNIPGYNHLGWNHIGVSRGINSPRDWRVFVNGNRNMTPAVTQSKVNAFHDNYIYSGEAWSIGTQPVANGASYSKTGGSILIDEARLITDEAIYKDSFTPPTAAYSL